MATVDAIEAQSDERRQTAPSPLSRNIVANFIGLAWTAAMGPALVSVYVKFLGIEAYGLVGVLTTLQVIFTLLDLGLSTTINRELARLSVQEGTAEEARDLVRTVETLYWSIAAAIGLIACILAPALAHHWLRAQGLSAATLQNALLIIGIILAVQFPFALYSGGLMGLQRQVLLNEITVFAATVRGVGAILMLWLVAPTVQVFFAWQLFATLLQTGLSAFFLWRNLPRAPATPRFRRPLLRQIWRFAAGLSGISFFALLLTQTDKVILSRLLTLERFGYYSLATTVASGLPLVVVPIFTAVFPQFSRLIARGEEASLRALYHSSCQVVSVAMLPIAVMLMLFAPEILRVWTRNPVIVANTHVLVTLLVAGTALNGLMYVPYALQLAAGWTKLALCQNAIAVVLLMPLLLWATNRYGPPGAAAIWITVNAGYVLFGIQVMHTRLLRGEQRAWYARDIGLPFAGALSVALIGRWLFPTGAPLLVTIGGLAAVSLLAFAAACLLAPLTNAWLNEHVWMHLARRDYAD